MTWRNDPFQIRFRVIEGLSIRFAQSEDHDDHALLLSPWPESLLAFEPMWARLAERTHLVAIDLPGFGHSQRRDSLLSPRAMSEFLIRAADSFQLDHPHVIGPDIATAAGRVESPRRLLLFPTACWKASVLTPPTSGPPISLALNVKLVTWRPGGVAPGSETFAAAHTSSFGHVLRAPCSSGDPGSVSESRTS